MPASVDWRHDRRLNSQVRLKFPFSEPSSLNVYINVLTTWRRLPSIWRARVRSIPPLRSPLAVSRHTRRCTVMTSRRLVHRTDTQYDSIIGAFTVYEDFPTYTIGVYHHVSGSDLGGHPIKIFGWSNEGGED